MGYGYFSPPDFLSRALTIGYFGVLLTYTPIEFASLIAMVPTAPSLDGHVLPC